MKRDLCILADCPDREQEPSARRGGNACEASFKLSLYGVHASRAQPAHWPDILKLGGEGSISLAWKTLEMFRFKLLMSDTAFANGVCSATCMGAALCRDSRVQTLQMLSVFPRMYRVRLASRLDDAEAQSVGQKHVWGWHCAERYKG
jgi:hypothetical protein